MGRLPYIATQDWFELFPYKRGRGNETVSSSLSTSNPVAGIKKIEYIAH